MFHHRRREESKTGIRGLVVQDDRWDASPDKNGGRFLMDTICGGGSRRTVGILRQTESFPMGYSRVSSLPPTQPE